MHMESVGDVTIRHDMASSVTIAMGRRSDRVAPGSKNSQVKTSNVINHNVGKSLLENVWDKGIWYLKMRWWACLVFPIGLWF